MLYTLGREGAYHVVKTQSGLVQFRSLSKANCKDWIEENTRTIDKPQEPPQLSHATINAARRIQSHATKAERFAMLSNLLQEKLSC
jgi:hypothetical protein